MPTSCGLAMSKNIPSGKKTAKTDGIPTTVEQVAKFQNYNLSTFKFQCSPAWRSCSCWRSSNFARPTGLRHVGEVAFSTLLRSESRTLPDNPPLSENGAKKDRLRAVKPSQSRSARQLSRRASFLTVRQSYPQQKKLPLSGEPANPKDLTERVYLRVYFFSCCSCSLRSSLMRFFSLLTWGHGQLKPSLALHQRVSG